jgi:dCTP deaminase
MTILSDGEIFDLCHAGMVVPFDPALLNPASIDVLLGSNLMIEAEGSDQLVMISIAETTAENPYLMEPGEFLLGQTIEIFNLPDSVAAEFRLKSSRAREGLDQALAVWADPGWHGSVLTVELRNNRRLHRIPLWNGMKIGQMVFHRMSTLPQQSYAITGNYNLDLTVQASKGHR